MPVRIASGDDGRSIRAGARVDDTMREQAEVPGKQDHVPWLDLPERAIGDQQDVSGADRRTHAVAGRAHAHATEPAQHVREEGRARGRAGGVVWHCHLTLRNSS